VRDGFPKARRVDLSTSRIRRKASVSAKMQGAARLWSKQQASIIAAA
jgi:hypothetical protein